MTEQSGLFIKELEKRMSNQNKLRKLENKRIELVRKIQLCKYYKEKIARFVQELNNQYNKGLISYKEYYYKLNRALEQRTPEQWVQEYDSSIWYYKHGLDSCEREIKKQENKAKIVPLITILAVFMILGFGFLFLKPTITGLIIGIGEEAYTQDISLVVNESSSYEWQPDHIGILSSARISGSILGNGSVRVYLDDKLILDSSKLEKSGISMITGLAISNLAETNKSAVFNEIGENITNITEETENITFAEISETIENITQEEIVNITAPEILDIEDITNIAQEVPENITIPEEIEANITIPEEINVSENITLPEEAVPELPEENITAPVPELREINITEIIFTDVCIETCSLNLNKTSYDLRFEIENAVLYLDNISYTIRPIEIPEEVPKAVENISKAEEIIQGQAEINKPVKWTKKITLDETISNLIVKLPKNISNVRVSKIKDKIKEEISSDKLKIREAEELKPISLITGYAVKRTEEVEEETELVIEDDVREIEIEYYTEAPEVTEKEINAHKKQIVVSSDVHYENILTYTSIRESRKELIKLYWLVNDSRELVSDVSYKDTNNNGLIDRLEWIVPSLSNQTYEIIIEISKAEHLDENYNFISDIYEEVKALDNVWSEPIYNDEYIRVVFKSELSSSRDITVYARNNQSLNTIIEVYYYNSTEKITEFPIISEEEYYKVYLTDMVGSHDTFDLKIKNFDNNQDAYLELDYIVDPANTTIFNDGFETDITTNWTVTSTWARESTGPPEGVYEGSWDAKFIGHKLSGDLYSRQVDTSGANVQAVYVKFVFYDDDCDAANDMYLDYNNSAGSWVQIYDLGAQADDAWTNYTDRITNSDYFHTGFAIRFRAYNFAATETFWVDKVEIIKEEAIAPAYSGAAVNDSEVFVGESVNHSITILDSPDGYIFSWNGTNGCSGGWSNSSWTDVSGASVTGYNVSTIGVGCGGKTIGWRFHANNSVGWGDSTIETYLVYNSVPVIEFQNIFVNCSAGHCFNVTAGVSDADGGSDITRTNISTTSGSCEHYINTTNGNYFNVTYNCSGTALASTNIIIGFNDSSGAYVQTTQSSNVYPDQAPTQPSLTNPANNAYITSIMMNWTASSDADDDTIYYYVLVNGTQACYTTDLNCSYSPASDSYYQWNVTPYDGTVNGTVSSSRYYTYDKTNPSVLITYPTADQYIKGTTLWVNGTVTETNEDTITINNTNWGTNQGTYSLWAFKNISYIADGVYSIKITANDSAGNVNNTETVSFTVDNSLPSLTITTSNNTVSNILTTIEGTASDINEDTIYANNTAWSWNNTYTNWKFTNNTNIADGNYHILITANDSAGNTNSSLFAFTYDTRAPDNLSVGKNDSTIKVNDSVLFYAQWSDSLSGLSNYIFSWNNSGTMKNDSAQSLTEWSNITETVNATETSQVDWIIYANDSAGNWNSTGIQTFTVAVDNTAPVVNYVSLITPQSVSAGGVSYISFTFNATDADGAANLNNSAARASFNLTGETTRTNTSCSYLAGSGNTRQYNCTIGVWYWDGVGNWTINASIRDINNAYAENSSTTFELQETTAMVMSPTALTWPSINLTDTNILSDNDPITINNTANKNIAYVNVTAIGLKGAEITSDFIYANNFSVNTADACGGTDMVNNTAIAVSGAAIPKGNNSAGQGQEELYFCLNGMLQTISAQTYSATGAESWTISVS